VSCASRDAPEPDSQSTKNKHAHRPCHHPPRFAGGTDG
jgi:hypothetical protein